MKEISWNKLNCEPSSQQHMLHAMFQKRLNFTLITASSFHQNSFFSLSQSLAYFFSLLGPLKISHHRLCLIVKSFLRKHTETDHFASFTGFLMPPWLHHLSHIFHHHSRQTTSLKRFHLRFNHRRDPNVRTTRPEKHQIFFLAPTMLLSYN